MAKEARADAAAEKQLLAQLEEEAARSARKVRDQREKVHGASRPELVEGKAYYVIKQDHYRKGVLYPAGTVVCVEDEAPSKTWRRVKPVRGAKVLPKPGAEAVPEELEENEAVVPLDAPEASPAKPAPATTSSATPPAPAKATEDKTGRPHDKKL